MEDIASQNMQTNATAKFGITKYSDLSPDEFISKKLSSNLSQLLSNKYAYNKPINGGMKFNEMPIHFLEENSSNNYRSFYSQGLLHKNLNFIPIKVDW